MPPAAERTQVGATPSRPAPPGFLAGEGMTMGLTSLTSAAHFCLPPFADWEGLPHAGPDRAENTQQVGVQSNPIASLQ